MTGGDTEAACAHMEQIGKVQDGPCSSEFESSDEGCDVAALWNENGQIYDGDNGSRPDFLFSSAMGPQQFASYCASGQSEEDLIKENVSILSRLLARVVENRSSQQQQQRQPMAPFEDESDVGGEESIVRRHLSPTIVYQLNSYVRQIASMYRSVRFHSFEHASHVLRSMNAIVAMVREAPPIQPPQSCGAQSERQRYTQRHFETYGISSQPLSHFALVFAALIHDVDHQGVPNRQLVAENHPLAIRYNDQSVAEQHSISQGLCMLFTEEYKDLREAIHSTQEEMLTFRRLVIDLLLATDIASPERVQIGKSKWKEAFRNTEVVKAELMERIKLLEYRSQRSKVPRGVQGQAGVVGGKKAVAGDQEEAPEEQTASKAPSPSGPGDEAAGCSASTTPTEGTASTTPSTPPSSPSRPRPRAKSLSRRGSMDSFTSLDSAGQPASTSSARKLCTPTCRRGSLECCEEAATKEESSSLMRASSSPRRIRRGSNGSIASLSSIPSPSRRGSMASEQSEGEDRLFARRTSMESIACSSLVESILSFEEAAAGADTDDLLDDVLELASMDDPQEVKAPEPDNIKPPALMGRQTSTDSTANLSASKDPPSRTSRRHSCCGASPLSTSTLRLGIKRTLTLYGSTIEFYPESPQDTGPDPSSPGVQESSEGESGGGGGGNTTCCSSSSSGSSHPMPPMTCTGSDKLKASAVLDHLIQCADVSHTMQCFESFLRWNARLYHELYFAHRSGRGGADVDFASIQNNWPTGQISFFDNYIVPLARRLKYCGVFGDWGNTFVEGALANRQMWLDHGGILSEWIHESAVAKWNEIGQSAVVP